MRALASATSGLIASQWIGLGLIITGLGLVGMGLAWWARRRRALDALARAAERAASGDPTPLQGLAPAGTQGRFARAVDTLAGQVRSMSASLAAQRNELRAIFQSMEGGVVVLDMQQRVLTLNQSAELMLGLRDGQVRGRLLQEVARQPDLNRFVESAIAGRRVEPREFALLSPAGRRVRAAGSPLHDAQGSPVGLLVVLNDITQLRRLEAVRSDFASNVSHELRTPITNIKGYVETLLETSLTDPEESLKFLRIIARNAERLGAIVEDMLMLTQLERPDASEALVTERVAVTTLAEAVKAELAADAAAKGIEVIAEVPAGLSVQGSPQLLEQALANLVNNAIKYSPRGTRVWIRALGIDGPHGRPNTEIRVVDEGPGIAEEHLSRLFERFYRVDKARSREQGGTGLGLAIVKHIAQVHGGHIEVESQLGHGSLFRLVLPAGEHDPRGVGRTGPFESGLLPAPFEPPSSLNGDDGTRPDAAA